MGLTPPSSPGPPHPRGRLDSGEWRRLHAIMRSAVPLSARLSVGEAAREKERRRGREGHNGADGIIRILPLNGCNSTTGQSTMGEKGWAWEGNHVKALRGKLTHYPHSRARAGMV